MEENKNQGLVQIEKIVKSYTSRWIREGMYVCHKDNLNVKMVVNKIIKQKRTIHVQDNEGKIVEKTFNVIHGVEVHFWDENKRLIVTTFHSRLLIPYDIAKLAKDYGIFVIEKFQNWVYDECKQKSYTKGNSK